jgi:hypothetical protein
MSTQSQGALEKCVELGDRARGQSHGAFPGRAWQDSRRIRLVFPLLPLHIEVSDKRRPVKVWIFSSSGYKL